MAADEEEKATASLSVQPVESIEKDAEVKNEEHEEKGAAEDEGDVMDTSLDGRPVSNEQYKALKAICDILYTHKITIKGVEDYYPSNLFRRIPNKRNLPEYYEVIKQPTAISTLKQKIQTKRYTGIKEFVNDFALIVHNAQIYNRPNSQPVRDVFSLKQVFDDELKKLVDEGLIKEEDSIYPNLGPIPDATPEPDPVSEDDEEEAEEDIDEEDEDEDVDDSDDEKRRKSGRRAGRTSMAGRKHPREEDDDGERADDQRKRRGRPPKVDTPMEARIKAMLKGLRKPRDDSGEFKIRHFEKLPDKINEPHYFQEIKEPIALDLIKRKAKRKKYNSEEHFMKDVNLMFDNAMAYNVDDSIIYRDAVDLKREAQELYAAEKAKPDEEYTMDDGRLPLPNGILYKDQLWRVGDWVHIKNPNDVTKPIVSQIYRTWQDPEGEKWINACWYYRPEQTVHQFERHFYPNEVVKTGQYRDHKIDEVEDRCFVMFFTRYNRGRPRNIGNAEVYVCEARYNEEKHKLNKIKTWASCLPDEVRDKDYEMDLFDVLRKVKKVPSPLLHLLKDDSKEPDKPPQPKWSNPNAPPEVGGIHRGPRDENVSAPLYEIVTDCRTIPQIVVMQKLCGLFECTRMLTFCQQSPPPEPTPPPPPTPPPQPATAPSIPMLPQSQSRPIMGAQPLTNIGRIFPTASTPVSAQLPPYQAAPSSATPVHTRQPSHRGVSQAFASGTPQTPSQAHGTPFTAPHQLHPPPSLAAAHPTSYIATSSQNYVRPAVAPHQSQHYGHTNVGSAGVRAPDVFVLRDTANTALPVHLRSQFPQDDHGHVLFFSRPPQDIQNAAKTPLTHSEAFLEAKMEKEKKLGNHEGSLNGTAQIARHSQPGMSDSVNNASDGHARPKNVDLGGARFEQKPRTAELLGRALRSFTEKVNDEKMQFYQSLHGAKWQDAMLLDQTRWEHQGHTDKEVQHKREEILQSMVVEPEYTTNVHKDPWRGTYLDDYDPRYGF